MLLLLDIVKNHSPVVAAQSAIGDDLRLVRVGLLLLRFCNVSFGSGFSYLWAGRPGRRFCSLTIVFPLNEAVNLNYHAETLLYTWGARRTRDLYPSINKPTEMVAQRCHFISDELLTSR